MPIYLRQILGFITLLGIGNGIQAQDPTPIAAVPHPYKFKAAIDSQLAESTEPWKYQLAAWEYSYIGEYETMLSTWDQNGASVRVVDTASFEAFQEAYTAQDALSYLAACADTAQVVIINEAHHQPMHRVFTTSLLIQLYQQGYRYLGLETLDKRDTALNDRKYPIYRSGTYSREPQFGQLIRIALQLGYTLFPYEAAGNTNGTEREIEQARNIQQHIQQDPQGKYLIHCGFAHAVEGAYRSWGKAMAGRLYEFTGINPLTINQTDFSEKSDHAFNHPLYQPLQLAEPSVFVDAAGHPFKAPSHPDWFDIMVFHPKTLMQSGRPHWLFRNQQQAVAIDLPKDEPGFPLMVLAFRDGEDMRQAVPCDIVYVAEEKDKVTLALAPGDYLIIYQTAAKEASMLRMKVAAN